MSDSVLPHRRQPTRLPRPWDSPDKNTGVGCHFLLQCMKVKSESEVAQSCPTLSDPMDCSLPGSSSMGFSRQEYWSGVPSPSPPCLPKSPQNTITPSILKYWGHAQYPQNNEGGKRSTGRGSDFPKVTQKIKGTARLRDWIFEFLNGLHRTCLLVHPASG